MMPLTDHDRPQPARTSEAVDLEELFAQYPALRQQLHQIYDRTQQSGLRGSHGQHRGDDGPRNADRAQAPLRPERAFEDGLKALRFALEQDRDQDFGLQAFLDFIEHRSVSS